MNMEDYVIMEEMKSYIVKLIKDSDAGRRALSNLDEPDFEVIAKVVQGLYNELDKVKPADREQYIVDYFILAAAAQQASFKVTFKKFFRE